MASQATYLHTKLALVLFFSGYWYNELMLFWSVNFSISIYKKGSLT